MLPNTNNFANKRKAKWSFWAATIFHLKQIRHRLKYFQVKIHVQTGWEPHDLNMNFHSHLTNSSNSYVHSLGNYTQILHWTQWPHCAQTFFSKQGPEVIKLFSCSSQLSMKFQLLTKTKISTNEVVSCFKSLRR